MGGRPGIIPRDALVSKYFAPSATGDHVSTHGLVPEHPEQGIVALRSLGIRRQMGDE